LNCLKDCPNGNVFDQYGCKTCDCIPDYTICSQVVCSLACAYGYVKDDKGCPTCTCVEKPTCLPPLCATACAYGAAADVYGCPTCDCKPCPAVECQRGCLYGYKKSITNGCEYCDCNPAPVCTDTNAAVGTACPLKCTNGLVVENGCTYCKCNPETPCKCGTVPTDAPKPCADGVSFQKYTGVCLISDANVCTLELTKCPIGISITVATALTDADIAAIKAKLGITNDADITVTQKTVDGKIVYTVWVNQAGIPAKTATQVNSDVKDGATPNHSDAVSYVLSDGTPSTSFANVVAPFIGLFILVLFF